MEAVGEQPVRMPKIFRLTAKGLVAVGMFLWAFGESAGRARAASELYRQGYVEEARKLML